jgi:hypothetical protein
MILKRRVFNFFLKSCGVHEAAHLNRQGVPHSGSHGPQGLVTILPIDTTLYQVSRYLSVTL